MQEWRYRHVKMVERTIGAKTGHRRLARRRVLDAPRSSGRSSPTSGRSGPRCDRPAFRSRICAPRPTRSPPTTAIPRRRAPAAHRSFPSGLAGRRARGALAAFDDAARAVDEKWGSPRPGRARARRLRARCSATPGGEIALGANTHELVVRFLRPCRSAQAPAGNHRRRVPHAPPPARATRPVAPVAMRESVRGSRRTRSQPRRATRGGDRRADRRGARFGGLLRDGADRAGSGRARRRVPSRGSRTARRRLPRPRRHPVRTRRPRPRLGAGHRRRLQVLPARRGQLFLRLPGDATCARWSPAGSPSSGQARRRRLGRVAYGPGAAALAGATYDPVSHYRARGCSISSPSRASDAAFLRAVSQHQIGLLAAGFDALDLDPRVIASDREIPLAGLGAFLALRSPRAGELCAELRRRGVRTAMPRRPAAARTGALPCRCAARRRSIPWARAAHSLPAVRRALDRGTGLPTAGGAAAAEGAAAAREASARRRRSRRRTAATPAPTARHPTARRPVQSARAAARGSGRDDQDRGSTMKMRKPRGRPPRSRPGLPGRRSYSPGSRRGSLGSGGEAPSQSPVRRRGTSACLRIRFDSRSVSAPSRP